MDEELRFDYNDYWTPEKLESNYVEESYDEPTDQDFWELHKFVLECELDICDGIYTESVGSVVRNTVGAIIDQIIESFLRICEAFGKQSMKSAVKWLKKNKRIIEHLGETESVHTILESLASIKNHYERIEAYARAFDNCSNVNNIPDEKLGKKVCEVIESLENDKDEIYSYENRKTRELDTSKISVSKLIDDVVGKLESGEYSKWRKFAQNLRSRMRKVIRAGLMDDILTDQFKTMDVARVPQRILWEFDSITANIKRLKKECDEASKELKIKKKSGQSVTESYHDLFESEHIEESSDVTDQDFWELHSFVLECELDIYGGIYSESVGSIVKASFGIILDKIAETFLRICEAFRKKSMRKAIRWLKDNVTIINEKCKGDEEVTEALIRILNGHKLISEYAEALEEWANTPNEDGTTEEKIANELVQISKSVHEQVAKRTPVKVSTLADKIANSLEGGGYDLWYGIARDLRTYARRKHRIAQAHETTNATVQMCLEIPKQMMDAFNDITEGIKTVKSRLSAITKAEAKAKKQTPKPATESYYVSFEPEVDILF